MWAIIDFLTGYTAPVIYVFIFLGLFVGGMGAPVSEDLILLLGGFLSWAGYTDLYLTIVISIVGAVTGDCVAFYIGRKWGHNVLNHPRFRRWLTSRRLEKIHEYFDRYGGKTVFFARFFAGFRLAVHLVAGTTRMKTQKFVLTDLAGALFSVPLVILAGFFLSEKIDTLRRTFLGFRIAAGLVVVVVCLGFLVFRWWAKGSLGKGKEELRVAEPSSADRHASPTGSGPRESL